MNKIIVILGPTSSGKSDIAIKLAKKFDAEIISADSRQIYRGMDIGTGKVRVARNRKQEIFSDGVKHFMLDIASPRTDYNVVKFKRQAEKIINDILKREKLPIICGGTGFWIQAIVNNVGFPEVKPDWKLRKRLDKYSAEKLFSMLKKMDPARAKKIDSKNKVRLIRAIEICKKIKKIPVQKNTPYSILHTQYNFLQIGLRLSKEKLHANIEKRVLARFRKGMIQEVVNLHKSGLTWKKIQSFGLAYFWIPLYLRGKLTKTKLVEKIIQAEKKYAKRQMTWFRRDSRIKWLKNYTQIKRTVEKFIH